MKLAVSSIGDFLFCPRNLYLKEKMGLGGKFTIDSARSFLLHCARRELSLRQHVILEKASHSNNIRNIVFDEIEYILPEIAQRHEDKLEDLDLASLIPKLEDDLTTDLKRLSERLSYLVSEAGMERALEKVKPWKTDYLIDSEKLGLTGLVDKVVREGNSYYPVDIKTAVPGDGVWDADKISVCAYSMLLEESLVLHRSIPSGFVEYMRVHETRPVMNSEELRRKVLSVRDEAVELLEGEVPEICPHGSGKKCDSCSIKEECYEV